MNKIRSKLREDKEVKEKHYEAAETCKLFTKPIAQGYQTHFHRGPHQPRGCLKRANVILGLYKCNYSITVKPELGAATR